MLIWKGHGFLIAVFGILGALVLGGAAWYLHAATQSEMLGRLVAPANAWGSALAIWLYGKTMGKPRKRMYLDTDTQRPVVEYVSHSLFFISPKPWAVVTAVMACVVTVLNFGKLVTDSISSKFKAPLSPAKLAFQEANRLIDADISPIIGHGNTPYAEKLAQAFASRVKRERETGIKASSETALLGVTHGKFLSYCRINPDSCVFMVHVPELRNFDESAKRFIVGLAWTMACKQAALLQPQPKRVAVGIRGALRYDEVVEGPLPDARVLITNIENENWEAGIERRYSEDEGVLRLESYFEPHPTGTLLSMPGQEQSFVGSILALASTEPEVQLPTPVRSWKEPSGREMRASLEGFTSPTKDTGRFKRADGRMFNVPFSRLCAEDQAIIRKIAAKTR